MYLHCSFRVLQLPQVGLEALHLWCLNLQASQVRRWVRETFLEDSPDGVKLRLIFLDDPAALCVPWIEELEGGIVMMIMNVQILFMSRVGSSTATSIRLAHHP